MEQIKHHWKQLINPDYIGAYTLNGQKEMNITILKVVREMVTGNGGKKEECTVAKLKDLKPFILNRTNSKTITKLAGSPYIEDWEGLTITVYATTTSVAGETVECLRVRPMLPRIENFDAEIEADIQTLRKATTLDELKKIFASLKWRNDLKVVAEKDKLKVTLK